MHFELNGKKKKNQTQYINICWMLLKQHLRKEEQYSKKIFMTQLTKMVWSLTQSQKPWNEKSSGP